jgi:predicted GTPase
MSTRNIILFGAIGAGKSSIVNLLFDQSIAPFSAGAHRCTVSLESYDFNNFFTHFRVWDTPGIPADDPQTEPIWDLDRLIKNVSDGVSLLVFIVRGARGPREEQLKTLRLVSDVLCGGRVPTIVAITNLENEENMDDWWFEHNGVFQRSGTHLAGYACITAHRGKLMRSGEYCYEDEYRESRDKLWTAIQAFSLREPVVFKG